MHFAASSCDSYSDDNGFTKISSKLEGVQPPYNDFSVSDIEQALNQLNMGRHQVWMVLLKSILL